VVDGVFHAVMLGLSESYLGALAVELGHGDTALALLVTVPLVAGASAQLLAGFVVPLLGSRKRTVVAGATLQALSLLGFVWIAATHQRALAPLLAAKILWWVAGSVIVPPWGAWMADLTEPIRRERYFAWRSAGVQLALLFAVVGGGIVLGRAQAGPEALARFELLFWGGVVARLLSALALSAKRDPASAVEPPSGTTRARLGQALRESSWRVPLYMIGMMFGAHVAIPFFTPYMLRTLALEYEAFGMLNALAVLSKAAIFPLCHRLSAVFGVHRVLTVGAIGVGLIPVLWTLADDVTGIAGIELMGGAVWALLEYASFQVLLGCARAEHRVEFFALYGTFLGLAQLAGSLLGSALLERGGMSYRDAFVLSSVLRLAALVVLVPAIRRLHVRPLRLFLRLVGTRPVGGGLARPVIRDQNGAEEDPERESVSGERPG